MPSKNIFWFKDIISDDIHTVGEKSVKLAQLLKQGILIPEGFAITSHAFDEFVRKNKLNMKAKHLMLTANHKHPHSVSQVSGHIKKYFNEGSLNPEFKLELYNAYKKLGGTINDPHVKIYLSPTSQAHLIKHDLPWNEVQGEASLIHSVKQCWSSNFSEINLINNHEDSAFTKSLIVQRVVDPDKSGKLYTIDPSTYNKNIVIIKTMLGEYSTQANFVSMPDIYEVDKKSQLIISVEEIPQQKMKKGKGIMKKLHDVTNTHKPKKKLTTNEVDQLLMYAKNIEKIMYFPQEIDWAIEKNKLYITHTKPITSFS